MRVFLPAYHLLAYHLSFLLFGMLGLALNLACLGFGWLPATARTERFFQRVIHRHCAFWLRWLSWARLVRFRFDGFEALPRHRGLVLAANHPGLMDATYLLARLPEAVFLFKPAIRRNPVLGAAARRAGYLASDGGHDALRAAAEKVAAGHTLVVFPEGTRSREGVLQPFKPGFILVARRAGAPIQLVRITCDSRLLVKGRAWWKMPRLRAHITIALGPCLPPPPPPLDEKTETILAGIEAWFRAGADAAPRAFAAPPPAAVATAASAPRGQTAS